MKSKAHKLECLRCAIKLSREGYRLIRYECKRADVVALHGPDELPRCVAIEVQLSVKNTLENVLRDFGNGCGIVINIAPDENIKHRMERIIERKLDPESFERTIVFTAKEFHETPLYELLKQKGA